MSKPYLSTGELTRRLKINQRRLERLLDRHPLLEPLRVSGRRLFSEEEAAAIGQTLAEEEARWGRRRSETAAS